MRFSDLLVASLVLSTISGAEAQQGRSGWQRDVSLWLNTLQNRTQPSRCIDRLRDKSVTVLGIPQDEPLIDEQVRRSLNRAIEAQIPDQYPSRQGEAYAQMIESILPQRSGGNIAAAQTLRDFYKSDMFVNVEVERWETERIALNVSLTILDPDTSTICTTDSMEDLVVLDVATLEQSAEPWRLGSGKPVHDLHGALKSSLVAAVSNLGKQPGAAGRPLPYAITSTFGGSGCDLQTYVDRELRSAYGEAAKNGGINQIIGAPVWPRLEPVAAPAADGEVQQPQLRVEIAPTEHEAAGNASFGLFSLTVSVLGTAAASPPLAYDVAVNAKRVAACREQVAWTLERIVDTAGSDPSRPVAIRPSQSVFVPGRSSLEVSVDLSKALYLYCWLLGDDGTAVIFYPNEAGQLVRPLPVGTYEFPRQFFKRRVDLPIRAAGTSLFGCFATASPVDQMLKDRWTSLAGNNLDLAVIGEFLDAFRAAPGVAEVYTWINHTGQS